MVRVFSVGRWRLLVAGSFRLVLCSLCHVSRFLFGGVGCRALCVMCCALFVVRNVLCVVCCVMCFIRCLLCCVSCVLFVGCCLPFIVRCLSCLVRCVL